MEKGLTTPETRNRVREMMLKTSPYNPFMNLNPSG